MKDLKNLFFDLVNAGSPSGFEEPMMKILTSELKLSVEEVYETSRGNVIGFQRGTSRDAPSIAVVAHMDQVGFIVFNIDEEGFIRFRKLGGSVTGALQGQQLQILTEKGPVSGVVGIKPGHITKPEEEHIIPPLEEMYIDIGTENREETEKMGVTIGTPIVYSSPPIELANSHIASPAVDNRAGCAALIATARELKNTKIPSSVYFIGSVEEETGLRGAEVALHDLKVDLAIAIDTFPAGWQPDVVMKDLFYEVGKGPGIHVGHITGGRIIIEHPRVRRWLVDTAETEGIPYQMGLMHGGTDAMAFLQTNTGIPAATLGLPRKYSHSPIEVFSLKDLQNLIKLLLAALKRLNSGLNLYRI